MAFVMWITGLPGSGKSTIALAVDQEREHVYRALVYTGKTLYELGHQVIMDATGNRKSWRQLARELIPEFYEIYLKCPVEICIKRERTRLDSHAAPTMIYEKGKAGWPVPGIK
jgi:adenylylsulfate kinase